MMSEGKYQLLRQQQWRTSRQLDQLMVETQVLQARIKLISMRITAFHQEPEPWYWQWLRIFEG